MMVSTVPEFKVRTIKVDVHNPAGTPHEGLILVNISKGRKPTKVYQVISFRKVNSKKHPNRFEIEAAIADDLLNDVRVGFRFDVYVKGEPAWALLKNRK